jgi:D-threo-aldose 1-dehydrogenase
MSLPAIPTTVLGRTGLRTTKLGIGTATFIARCGDDVLLSVMRAAFKAGVRHLDTARLYGTEERVGRLLPEAEAPPDLLIVTKCGHTQQGPQFTADNVRRHAEESLRFLRLQKLPLLLVHDCMPWHLDVVFGRGGTLEGLRKLQADGLVGHIGMATRAIDCLKAAVASGEFDVIQFPRHYTLLNQPAARDLLEPARAKNLGVINVSPFAGSILATGTIPGALYAYQPAIPEVVAAVKRIEARCAELGVELPPASLAYSLTEPGIDVTVIGTVSAEELHDDVRAFDLPLTRAQLESIAAAAQIDPALLGAPTYVTNSPATVAAP